MPSENRVGIESAFWLNVVAKVELHYNSKSLGLELQYHSTWASIGGGGQTGCLNGGDKGYEVHM